MTWARFDDLYDDNRKVKRAWRRHPRAVGLHAMAVTYSSRHETDGLVDIDWIEEKLPKDSERAAVLAVLVDVGLFVVVDDEHYRVHDYLDFNPSRAYLDERRAADAERKRRGKPRGLREDSTRSPDGGGAESNGTPRDPSRAPAPAPAARPVPSRPDPIPPRSPASGGDDLFPSGPGPLTSKRQRDQERHRAAEAAHRSAARAFAAEHFPDEHPDAILNTATVLTFKRVEPTAERIRAELAASRQPLEASA